MIYDDIKTIDDAINEAALEMRSLKEKQHEEQVKIHVKKNKRVCFRYL